MKILSFSCVGALVLVCSLAALYRYWLIMTIGVGFAGSGDAQLMTQANVSLAAGGAGMILLIGTPLGLRFLPRRKLPHPNAHSTHVAGMHLV